MSGSQPVEILDGRIIDWNWIRDYGLIKTNDNKEYFLYYTNVKIKARDEDNKLIKLKLNDKGFPITNAEGNSFVRADEDDPEELTQQIYGRPAARGFKDEAGNDIQMKKHQVWFDIDEKVYFTTSKEYPNMALNVTLKYKDTQDAI